VELAGLNLIGLKRRGLSRGTINAMRRTFRSVFYGDGGSIADRARAAKVKFAGVAEVAEIVDFILADSKQELCLARRRGEGA
jgi:UDP-N-acetylglucosamine acyltransferase